MEEQQRSGRSGVMPRAPGADVLYIHPTFHQSPNAIPMGVAGLINSLDCTKLGLFSSEVTEAHLKAVRVVALDLHWFYPLHAVPQLAAAYKRVNPELKDTAFQTP